MAIWGTLFYKLTKEYQTKLDQLGWVWGAAPRLSAGVGFGQGPDGPPQEQGFKGLAPWGVWGAAPGSPQEWGLGHCPNSSPQEQGFKGLAPCTWGTIITRMSLHGAEPQWGLGQRPRGVRGAAPMPSAGARDR
ncbi:uncharacterized protein EI90DRAFT_3014888 [Cantharellus anzutake]|uniref:uncharacterized protein n=1 Tax=Cantharellus anzutake TaxID=1750568 RepID=UPI001908A05F|nr:uncharacterized protein EI90DRAFT_3014888 [Cantharellus anzutake]KAF8334613.1 hypothetical protein EI90DRAFT_3014888 [Cantharellus anzutake]